MEQQSGLQPSRREDWVGHLRDQVTDILENTLSNKICLGMKTDQQFKSVVINHPARSLYSLIAHGKYRATSLGRNTWKKLIGSRASLQPNCNGEGFNVLSINTIFAKARIGVVDSRIGFAITEECSPHVKLLLRIAPHSSYPIAKSF